MKPYIALLTATILSGMAPMVTAQIATPFLAETPEDTLQQDNPPEGERASDLYSAVEAIHAVTPVTDVEYIDWFGYGEYSALLRTDVCDVDGCQWLFVAKSGASYETVGGGHGKLVTLETTDNNGKMISADGVTWAWTGQEMLPWGDIISYVSPRRPNQYDLSHLNALYPQSSFDHERAQVWDIDPFGAIWNHRLIELSDPQHELRPPKYILINRLGELIFEHNFGIRPYIFPTYPGRASIIAYTAEGLTQSELVYDGELR